MDQWQCRPWLDVAVFDAFNLDQPSTHLVISYGVAAGYALKILTRTSGYDLRDIQMSTNG